MRKIKSRKIPSGVFTELANAEDAMFLKSKQRGIIGDLQEADRKGISYMQQKYNSLCEEIAIYEKDPDVINNIDRLERYYHEAETEAEIKLYNKMAYYKSLLNLKEELLIELKEEK
jgi:hypothetical protein